MKLKSHLSHLFFLYKRTSLKRYLTSLSLRAFFNIKKREQEKPIHFSFQNKLQGWKMYLEITWSEVKWSESRSVMSDSLRPHGLYSPRNSSGQNTGVGSLSLPQGIFPIQGSNWGLLLYRRILYQLSHKGSCSEGKMERNHRRVTAKQHFSLEAAYMAMPLQRVGTVCWGSGFRDRTPGKGPGWLPWRCSEVASRT